MVDDGIYTKNADILAEAGDNADATAKATAATDVYVLNVEAAINSATRKNWSDLFTAGLNADVGGILTETGASLCAIKVLKAKPTGDDGTMFIADFEGRVNLLRDTALRNIQFLRDIKVQTFILGETP